MSTPAERIDRAWHDLGYRRDKAGDRKRGKKAGLGMREILDRLAELPEASVSTPSATDPTQSRRERLASLGRMLADCPSEGDVPAAFAPIVVRLLAEIQAAEEA